MSSGLGQSKSAEAPAAVGELAPAGFLKEVCERLSLTPAVVISPSLSGMYSLPFLHQHQALIRAYIPVAPICTDKFTAEQYQSVKVQSYKPLLYIPLQSPVLQIIFTVCVLFISSLKDSLSSHECQPHFPAPPSPPFKRACGFLHATTRGADIM